MAAGTLIARPTSAVLSATAVLIPELIARAGRNAIKRFVEYFTARIANPNTREAYHRDCLAFFSWCEQRGVRSLSAIQPPHVAAYLVDIGHAHASTSVRRSLAAIRGLFDWLVVGQVIPLNPAHPVRGPKHVVEKGKTPVLSEDEARHLLATIDTSSIVGLRDRALIATMLYSFARVEAAVGMDVDDYYIQGRRSWLRLLEKGGKYHEMPAHHKLEEFLDAFIRAIGGAGAIPFQLGPSGRPTKRRALFRTAYGKTHRLTANRMTRKDAWRMIRRRARDAGIETRIGCHSFRATGITNYLENGGTLEKAQKMAAHSSARTTKLYDRRDDQVTLDEIERIAI